MLARCNGSKRSSAHVYPGLEEAGGCLHDNLSVDALLLWNRDVHENNRLRFAARLRNEPISAHSVVTIAMSRPCSPRGVPTPISCRMSRPRLKPAVWISSRLRMFVWPRR
jgi:hypothetical protein